MNGNSKKLMTIREVAEFLKLSPHMVREYCKKGILKANKVGVGKNTRWRIWEDDMFAFINKKGVG